MSTDPASPDSAKSPDAAPAETAAAAAPGAPRGLLFQQNAPASPAAAARQARQARLYGAPVQVPVSGNCAVHGEVAAVRACMRCKAGMCATCDFAFPDGAHMCPACVANPFLPVSARRKRLAFLALVCGASPLLALVAQVLHLYDATNQAGATLVGTVFMVLPTIVGITLSLMALDKRLGNSGLLWSAVILNGLDCALLVLAMVINAAR